MRINRPVASVSLVSTGAGGAREQDVRPTLVNALTFQF